MGYLDFRGRVGYGLGFGSRGGLGRPISRGNIRALDKAKIQKRNNSSLC